MTVNVLNPRKSIFNNPSSSKVVIIYCVAIVPSFTCNGTYVSTGSFVITTPHACVDACLGIPSNAMAMSNNFFIFSSLSYSSLSSLFSSIAFFIVICNSFGTIFASLSVSAYGKSNARPTSLITILADIVPNVIICDTWSLPYFSAT